MTSVFRVLRQGSLSIRPPDRAPLHRRRNPRLAQAIAVALAVLGGIWMIGCAAPPRRHAPVAQHCEGDRRVLAFDMSRSGRPDYWEYTAGDGRVRALAFADERGQAGQPITLDAMDPASVPHFVIFLDGVPFEMVVEARRAGLFRLFYPPSKVICCYPSMTDLSLAEIMHAGPCRSLQAGSFDRAANRNCGGNSAYLSAENAPWAEKVDFRASRLWDMLTYVDPQKVFNHELQGMRKTFAKVSDGQAYGYTVGTAGLGTRFGRDGVSKYLADIDAFCQQLVYEHRGHVKITLAADHAHNMTPSTLVSFRDVLKSGGYRETDSLCEPRDVVTITFGLVTYAEFFTKDAPGLARCLLNHEAVNLTSYVDADRIVVTGRDGVARISKGPGGGFFYDRSQGDPLNLGPILERLTHAGKVSPTGEIDDRALFEATVDHEYPDPLARLWRTYNGLVEIRPDVIADLRDGFCHGSQFFYNAVGGSVASTHGSLSRSDSVTFAMSMLGDLPPALRSVDILQDLAMLRQPARLVDSD